MPKKNPAIPIVVPVSLPPPLIIINRMINAYIEKQMIIVISFSLLMLIKLKMAAFLLQKKLVWKEMKTRTKTETYQKKYSANK